MWQQFPGHANQQNDFETIYHFRKIITEYFNISNYRQLNNYIAILASLFRKHEKMFLKIQSRSMIIESLLLIETDWLMYLEISTCWVDNAPNHPLIPRGLK